MFKNQATTEYILIVILVAILSIGIITIFGDLIRAGGNFVWSFLESSLMDLGFGKIKRFFTGEPEKPRREPWRWGIKSNGAFYVVFRVGKDGKVKFIREEMNSSSNLYLTCVSSPRQARKYPTQESAEAAIRRGKDAAEEDYQARLRQWKKNHGPWFTVERTDQSQTS